MNKEIEIPEGYEARIEGSKVVLEPKESEDEKIRKEMINFISQIKALSEHGCCCGWDTRKEDVPKYERFIAYLENQKEQKPAEWSEWDETMLKLIISELEEEGKDVNVPELYRVEINWLKSRRPQHHWKPSEDQIQALYNILRDPKKAGSISDRANIVGLIHDLKKLM